MSPVRVGFLVYEIDQRAGMQRQAQQLLPRLSAAGLAVRVVSTVAPRDLRARRGLVPRGAEGLPLVRLPVTRTGVFEAAARAWLAAQGGVDVLLGLGWHEALHAARIARRTGLPFVARYACSGAHGDLAALADRPRLLGLLRGAARHVCISDEILREAQQAGLPSERLVAISNGVDLAAWSQPAAPASLPFPAGSEVLLCVGRLTRQKRIDVLLEAVARLVPARPALRVALCGTGPLRGELEQQARDLGIAERVAFLGVRDDLLALHRAARAFVLPSEGEGLPNALLEALAAGTPTVATAVPGTLDVVGQSECALLAPPNEPAALARALERVLSEAPLRERLASAGPARVRAAFDADHTGRRYAEVLREAAASGPPPRRGGPELAGGLARRLRRPR